MTDIPSEPCSVPYELYKEITELAKQKGLFTSIWEQENKETPYIFVFR